MPSDYLKALHALRTLFVQVRRRNVADSVRHDLPAGNEQRLIQTQNAIAAVDAAILDEERLAAWGEEDRTMFDVEGKVAADGAMNGIRIEAHHHGNGHGDQPAPAEDGTAGAKYFNGASTWRSYEAWRRSSRAG
ncbi:MAG TPA: hypothetical protein VGA77_06750 [Propylenella sp.]